MLDLPTYVFPFVLAVIAFLAGRFLVGRVGDDAGSLPGWILYAVAIACTVIGLVAIWMETRY